jgi:hypothetical protein
MRTIMELERLFPLFLIWIIYTIFIRMRRVRKKDVGPVVTPAPAVHGKDSGSRPQDFRAEPLMAASEKERATQPLSKSFSASAGLQQKSSRRRQISTRAFLRRAVVWSEILRPPVSMRSEE